MGHNRAGARLRERRKRRANLERIYRETHCKECGDDYRPDLTPVWNETGTKEVARLCSVCNAYRNLAIFEDSGLLREDLFTFAWGSYPYWNAPEDKRNPQEIPFFDEGPTKALVQINDKIVHRAAMFLSQVWPTLEALSLTAPVLVGKGQDLELIVTDWMQEGQPYITLQQKAATSGREQPSLTFGRFAGQGEYEGKSVVEITDIYCTEEQAHRLLDAAIQSPPDCKPVAV